MTMTMKLVLVLVVVKVGIVVVDTWAVDSPVKKKHTDGCVYLIVQLFEQANSFHTLFAIYRKLEKDKFVIVANT